MTGFRADFCKAIRQLLKVSVHYNQGLHLFYCAYCHCQLSGENQTGEHRAYCIVPTIKQELTRMEKELEQSLVQHHRLTLGHYVYQVSGKPPRFTPPNRTV